MVIAELFLLQQLSPNYLNIIFYPAFHYFLPPLRKSEHDADLCVFLLKQLLQYYVNKSTKVFAAVLAGSKAFYRTKHNLLFTKLMYLCVYLCAMYLCVQ